MFRYFCVIIREFYICVLPVLKIEAVINHSSIKLSYIKILFNRYLVIEKSVGRYNLVQAVYIRGCIYILQ
jgi:hypothetical protein